MPTGLTYSSYKTQIATMAVVEESDPSFNTILPMMIDYAELRIYRDLDLLSTSDSLTFTLVSGARKVTVPAGTFVVSEQINLITPPGTSNPETGMRVPLMPTSKEFLDAAWGSASATGVPKYYAPFKDNEFIVGPFPNNTYTVEIVGTVRPATLSLGNSTTFISQYLPDLFVMASMVYISGFQRNFGRQSDDPQMAVSYESQYQTLLKGAMVEEVRKKYASQAWSSESPSPLASPSR
jgi:hypothetical protein